MRTGGIALVAIGILALIYGGINYSKNRTVIEIGSMSVTATEQKRIPIPAVLGVVLLLGGAGLFVAATRRPRVQ